MGDTNELIRLMQQQIELQQKQFQSQQEAQAAQIQQILQLVNQKTAEPATTAAKTTATNATATTSVPPFTPFDPSSELWPDYFSRFQNFLLRTLFQRAVNHNFFSQIRRSPFTDS